MSDNWQPSVVVVGTDGSDGAIRAARVATSIANQSGSALHIVAVVRPPEGWWGIVGSPPTPQAYADALADAQRNIIDATMEAIRSENLEVTTAEEVGDPADGLIEYAARESADLLVVGRRGAGIIERLVLGSVADRVVHQAPCPVLVVP